MSIHELLQKNARYSAGFEGGGLHGPPARRLCHTSYRATFSKQETSIRQAAAASIDLSWSSLEEIGTQVL